MQQIRVLCRKFGPFEDIVKLFYKQYAQQSKTDLQLELLSLPLPELHREILKGEFDVAHVNTDWLAECRDRDCLEDLSQYLQRDPPEAYENAWSESMLALQTFPDRIAGLPFHDGPECLIYRKDLFYNPVEQESFLKQYGYALEPPKTWEAFADAAEFFNRDGMYGTLFALYPDGHNNIFDFALQIWSRGGELTGPDGRLTLDTFEARSAMEFYRELVARDFVHKQSREFESIAACHAFARGEAAMMVNWFGFATMCETEGSLLKGKVDIAPVPHEPGVNPVSLNVYYVWAIGKNSSIKNQAYEYIKNAVSIKNDALLPFMGAVGCRRETWENKNVNDMIPYYKRLDEIHAFANTLPRIPQWNAMSAIIDELVIKVTDTQEPVETILSEAQGKADSIYQGRGGNSER